MVPSTRAVATSLLLAEAIPAPLVDTLVQNEVRRAAVRAWAPGLAEDGVRELADAPLAPVRRVLLWPVKKLLAPLRLLLFPVSVARLARDVADLRKAAVATSA